MMAKDVGGPAAFTSHWIHCQYDLPTREKWWNEASGGVFFYTVISHLEVTSLSTQRETALQLPT